MLIKETGCQQMHNHIRMGINSRVIPSLSTRSRWSRLYARASSCRAQHEHIATTVSEITSTPERAPCIYRGSSAASHIRDACTNHALLLHFCRQRLLSSFSPVGASLIISRISVGRIVAVLIPGSSTPGIDEPV